MKLISFLILLVPSVLLAQPIQDASLAVVRLETETPPSFCSGFCVHPSGLVMTAKHCELGEKTKVTFPGSGPVPAVRVYESTEADGPVVYDAMGDGFAYLDIAPAVPEAGESVWSMGYPHGGTLQTSRGVLTRGSEIEIEPGQRYPVNVATLPAQHGWSGGPLLNTENQVVGILSAGRFIQNTPLGESYWLRFAETREAFLATTAGLANGETPPRPDSPPVDSPPAGRPVLVVWSKDLCPPCLAFWSDYESDAGFRRWIDHYFQVTRKKIDDHKAEAEALGVIEAPAFTSAGVHVNGYRLLRSDRKTILARQLGIFPKRTPDSPDSDLGNPAPIEPPEAEPDLSDVRLVVLVARQDLGAVKGLLAGLVEAKATGPIRRRISDATDGRVEVDFLFERTDPNRFRSVTAAAGVYVERATVLALVARQDLGIIKGLVVKKLTSILEDKLENAPLEFISERNHPADFAAVKMALAEIEPIPQTEPVPWERETEAENEQEESTILSKVAAVAGKLDALGTAVDALKTIRGESPEDESDELPGGLSLSGVAALLFRRITVLIFGKGER